MRNALIVLLLAVLAVGGGVVWSKNRSASPAPAAERSSQSATSSAADFSWHFSDAGENADIGAPLSKVTLTFNETEYEAGTFTGSCAVKSADLLSGEESAVVCWFAGGGKEIGVFNDNGVRTLKAGDVDEGSAETPGFRGNFVTLAELN